MKYTKVFSLVSVLLILFVGNASATTSSQILVMSNQLYQIAKDLTTGILPTSILLIAIGFEDGNKVFIRMPDHVDHSQLPIFMTIDRSGQTEVVNYRYFRPYYVVDTIFEQGVLILGTEKYRQTVRLTKV